MLGERRSKAAFSAGFPEAVREETRQDGKLFDLSSDRGKGEEKLSL